MNELAFNADGESFEVPATVTGWRVRRMKPRGVSELVYGKDGRPLTIDVHAEAAELRETLGFAGKYRLEPVDEAGKRVDDVPAAYIKILAPERVGSDDAFREALRETLRMNTELTRSVIEKFAEMTSATAELLRAADRAGSRSS